MNRPPTSVLVTGARTLGALALLTAMLPVNLAITVPALLRRRSQPPPRSASRRTVLISGGKMTKALHLCRAFSAAGHRVVLVETAKYRLTGHRFSRAVDAFHVVPKPTDPGYAAALLAIVRAEQVDLYVPVCSPLASRYDALAARTLAGHCEVLHADAELVELLDDKYRFAAAADDLGLGVPDTHLVTEAAAVSRFDFAGHDGRYVLKNLAYDPVNRLDLTPLPRGCAAETARFALAKPISPDNPWILQSFLTGREWCTHTTARDGRVLAYVCCPSSAFQVNYESVDVPAVEAWVHRFVAALNITGQVSFDFIESATGEVFAIECNPRTHSAITTFQDLPELAAAYLDERPAGDVLRPAASAPTYWLYHELWRIARDPRRARERLRVIARGRDAVFDRDDPLPFLLLHHLQIPMLLMRQPGSRTTVDADRLQHRQARRTRGRLMPPAPRRVLHLVGSPTSEFFADLSRLYAAGCLAAVADPERWEPLIAYVSPDGDLALSCLAGRGRPAGRAGDDDGPGARPPLVPRARHRRPPAVLPCRHDRCTERCSTASASRSSAMPPTSWRSGRTSPGRRNSPPLRVSPCRRPSSCPARTCRSWTSHRSRCPRWSSRPTPTTPTASRWSARSRT